MAKNGTPDQVAHAWAHDMVIDRSPAKSQPYQTPSQNMSRNCSGDLYSYNTVIAKRLAEGRFLITTRSYSNTTAKHLSAARRAVFGFTCYVNDIELSARGIDHNLSEFVSSLKDIYKKWSHWKDANRKAPHARSFEHLRTKVSEYVNVCKVDIMRKLYSKEDKATARKLIKRLESFPQTIEAAEIWVGAIVRKENADAKSAKLKRDREYYAANLEVIRRLKRTHDLIRENAASEEWATAFERDTHRTTEFACIVASADRGNATASSVLQATLETDFSSYEKRAIPQSVATRVRTLASSINGLLGIYESKCRPYALSRLVDSLVGQLDATEAKATNTYVFCFRHAGETYNTNNLLEVYPSQEWIDERLSRLREILQFITNYLKSPTYGFPPNENPLPVCKMILDVEQIENDIEHHVDLFTRKFEENAAAIAAEKHREAIANWRAERLSLSELKRTLGSNLYNLPIMLRAVNIGQEDEAIETSRDAKIPGIFARRVWPKLLAYRAGTLPADKLPAQWGCYHFQPQSQESPDCIVVGCHEIAWTEIEYIATQLGLSSTAVDSEQHETAST